MVNKLITLLGLLAISLMSTSCKKEQTLLMDGNLKFEIKSSKELSKIYFQYAFIIPVESDNVRIPFSWESISNLDGVKAFESSKLLTGTYQIDYQIRYENTGGYANGKLAFQIFPGESTTVSINF